VHFPPLTFWENLEYLVTLGRDADVVSIVYFQVNSKGEPSQGEPIIYRHNLPDELYFSWRIWYTSGVGLLSRWTTSRVLSFMTRRNCSSQTNKLTIPKILIQVLSKLLSSSIDSNHNSSSNSLLPTIWQNMLQWKSEPGSSRFITVSWVEFRSVHLIPALPPLWSWMNGSLIKLPPISRTHVE
jgi:hypothetical protein